MRDKPALEVSHAEKLAAEVRRTAPDSGSVETKTPRLLP